MRELVVHNFRWKLTALLLALLLWFVIKFAIYKEITGGRNQVLRAVPVLVLNAPDDPRVFRIDPPRVDLVIQASTEITAESVEAFLDLSHMPEVNSALKQVLVRAADGVKVIETNPAFVLVERTGASDSTGINSPRRP